MYIFNNNRNLINQTSPRLSRQFSTRVSSDRLRNKINSVIFVSLFTSRLISTFVSRTIINIMNFGRITHAIRHLSFRYVLES